MKRIFAVLVVLFATAMPGVAFEIGDDGLHKEVWMRDTFKDLREDLDEANAEGKRLILILEQRGCVYCQKMHEEVFSQDRISSYIIDNYFVVQINLHGDTEVIDFDGDVLTEKSAARKWGMLFTPTMIFLPQEVPEDQSAIQAQVAMMPGAFAGGTTLDMLTWVNEERYLLDGDEDFQRYHARMIQERDNGRTD